MNKLFQIMGLKSVAITFAAIVSFALPATSQAISCITVDVSDDGGACNVHNVAYWDYTQTTDASVYPTGDGVCNDGQIRIQFGTIRSKYGRLYIRSECGEGQYGLKTAVGTGGTGWLNGNLRVNGPTTLGGIEYWYSNEITAVNANDVTANLTYEERATYTTRYDFEGGTGTPSGSGPVESDWKPLTEVFSISARDFAGYRCVGWSGGGAAFGASDTEVCKVNDVHLRSGNNEITWLYKKIWDLQTIALPFFSGPGVGALVRPYEDFLVHEEFYGDKEVEALAIVPITGSENNRFRLTGSSSIEIGTSSPGSMTEDSTGLTLRNFRLERNTRVSWLYLKESKLTVGFDDSVPVPQSVRDASVDSELSAEGTYWEPSGDLIEISINSLAIDPGTGDQWRCTGWIGTGDVASGNDCENIPAFNLTQESTLTWIFSRSQIITVEVEGLDNAPAPGQLEPAPGNSYYAVNSAPTISAQNIIAGPGDRTRFVLERWVGTGNIPLSGFATSGVDRTEITIANLDQDSTIRWIYTKELGVRVGTNNLVTPSVADPWECITNDYTFCIDNLPAGARESVDAYGVNYYPEGTQLTLTTEFLVNDDGQDKNARGLILEAGSGSLLNSTGQQTHAGRKAEAFTLNAPVHVSWDYGDSDRLTIGEKVPKPDLASETRPRIENISPSNVTEDQAFFWSAYDKRLYPLQPITSARIIWDGAPLQDVIVSWPTEQQTHIAETPANIAPASTSLNLYQISYTENEASVVNGKFQANGDGKSVLLFLDGGDDPVTAAVKFIVVNTVKKEDVPGGVPLSECTVGTTLDGSNYNHADPEDRSGYVFNTLSFYDGAGPNKAHDRDQRRGPIIPVNTAALDDASREMLVVWYSTDNNGIGWPTSPVRYNCQWPVSQPLPAPPILKIVIASPNGFPADADSYEDGRIYYQSDPELPGYNLNEEHASYLGGSVFALRDDFNNQYGNSEPFVLFKYRAPSDDWEMLALKVVRTSAEHDFTYDQLAGERIFPNSAMAKLSPGVRSELSFGASWYHLDRKGGHWAKAANSDGTSAVTMSWYYPMQNGFFYPDFDADTFPDAVTGDEIPFLGHLGGGGVAAVEPHAVIYDITWPTDAPLLRLGETLIKGKNELPDLLNMASAKVLFDEALYDGEGHLVKLFDALAEHRVWRDSLPEDLDTESRDGKVYFKDLPFFLRARFFYDPAAKEIVFGGILDTSGVGDPLLLPNVMNLAEKDALLSYLQVLRKEISQLFTQSRNPGALEFQPDSTVRNPYSGVIHEVADWTNLWGLGLGMEADENGDPQPASLLGAKNALSAGTASGTGYVTLAENDHDSLGEAVALHVIQVSEVVYAGELKIIESDNVFDEKLTLRHIGDFGGEPGKFYMEWYFRPDEAGVSPSMPDAEKTGWQLLASGQGMSEYTIEGADVRTLSDNWVVMRYYYRDVFPVPPVITNTISTPEADSANWSDWAGAPGNTQAMLAEGWLKRVTGKLNPLEARVRDFQRNETNTLVSMIAQAGAYCGSDIALNSSAENLNSVGLVAAYQTLLRRGMSLSVDSGQDYAPANAALLNMATRVSDLYMLLANEAYADAIDPTIGFTTSSDELGSFAPATFAFQNQLESSLEEELVLLRGRDDTASTTRACPIFNRLFWNFTNGDGEVAYVQTYNVTDEDTSGVVNEADAQIKFPQGHGDAWGHYLSAMKPWYRLLANDNFTWEPRAESVLVAGVPVLVDYLDERKFAQAAAAKARAGVEIIDLTYRSAFVDDANGQWQGYKDTDEDRAWGVDEWSRRVGNGAYMDWVLGNAMLPPADPNPEHTGIQRIDRTTVNELAAIASQFHATQDQIDKADAGLNPLGLARGVVPFDIDPSFLDVSSSIQGLTHFEQIYSRALKALQNATKVFDFANEFTQSLRRSTDSLDDFKQNLNEQETDFKNRLIEIFGYPYSDDIGPGRTYPTGYDGPDWAHFMIVERSELTGKPGSSIASFDIEFDFSLQYGLDPDLGVTPTPVTVNYPVAEDGPWIVKPEGWSGSRRATGEIQNALSEYMQAESEFRRVQKELEVAIGSIDAGRETLEQKYQVASFQIQTMQGDDQAISNLEASILNMNKRRLTAERSASIADGIFQSWIDGLPKSFGLSSDPSFSARAAFHIARVGVVNGLGAMADTYEYRISDNENAISAIGRSGDITLAVNDARYEVQQLISELGTLLNVAIVKQYETYQLQEAMGQSLGRFNAAVARGERLLSERAVQRKLAAADVQDYRYNDISFRVFRNDALQKYRAQFDLAARYVYLAAMAYDYETNLLGSSSGSGSQFLSEIFRQRSLGQMVDGQPVAGLGGLADSLARLEQNFDLYKTRLGFNNPQTETNRFSLRKEHFRLRGDASSDALWKTELASHMVPDLWDEEDFKRYALPFTTEQQGEQPAIVIPFSTTVTFGKNFFGWPLSGGDSAYDPTNFATKVRSVGVWFEGYPLDQLSQTPRVYLVPIGADVLRSPGDDSFSTRQWNIVDQKLPAPFSLGASDLADPDWIPVIDSLSDDLGGIRRYPSLRAYKYTDGFDDAETTSNSRLIGRSVWNTQWLLIIPGGTLLFDPETGLDTFLNNVTDIKLFFQTYSYNGE